MRFQLFNLNKDGKGVDKDEDTTPNILFYFKSLWRKFPRLISINLLMLLQFVPLLIAFLIYFWGDTVPTFTNLNFPVYFGIAQLEQSTEFSLLMALSSTQFYIPALSVGTLLWIAFLVILTALLFGPCNVAFTYLMRELVRGNPVFIFSDIKYALKKNFKQGLWVGLADFAILFILIFNIITMQNDLGAFGNIMYFANLGILTLYIIMRFYLYLMLITFDIKFFKMIKNALIFVVLGIKRNILAILWIFVLLLLNFLIFTLYIPLGISLPILYIFSVSSFTTAYAAYPVIDKYMIAPYLTEENTLEEEPNEE